MPEGSNAIRFIQGLGIQVIGCFVRQCFIMKYKFQSVSSLSPGPHMEYVMSFLTVIFSSGNVFLSEKIKKVFLET